MQCPLGLGSGRTVHAGPLLSTGQYAMVSGIDDGYQMQLEVWELPGYSPSPKGWASSRGRPGLDSRAR